LFWAFSTRCHPDEHRVYPNQDEPMPLMGFLTEEERISLKCPKIIYNCLRPEGLTRKDLPIPAKFEDNWPKDIQERVLKNWSKYGYDETA
jgi:4-hydroxy-3-polyprenylbenzoate decarboxylase